MDCSACRRVGFLEGWQGDWAGEALGPRRAEPAMPWVTGLGRHGTFEQGRTGPLLCVLLLSDCPNSNYPSRPSLELSSARDPSWISQPKVAYLSAIGPFPVLSNVWLPVQFCVAL